MPSDNKKPDLKMLQTYIDHATKELDSAQHTMLVAQTRYEDAKVYGAPFSIISLAREMAAEMAEVAAFKARDLAQVLDEWCAAIKEGRK